MTTIAYILDQCRKKDARPNLQPLVSGANLDRHVRGSKGVTGTIMECSIVIQGARVCKGWGKKITGLVLGPVRVMAQISVRFARILFGYLDLYLHASQLLIFSISWLLLRDYPRLSISPSG